MNRVWLSMAALPEEKQVSHTVNVTKISSALKPRGGVKDLCMQRGASGKTACVHEHLTFY